MESEQHATKKREGQQRNQRKLKNTLRKMTKKTTTIQILRDAAKAVL